MLPFPFLPPFPPSWGGHSLRYFILARAAVAVCPRGSLARASPRGGSGDHRLPIFFSLCRLRIRSSRGGRMFEQESTPANGTPPQGRGNLCAKGVRGVCGQWGTRLRGRGGGCDAQSGGGVHGAARRVSLAVGAASGEIRSIHSDGGYYGLYLYKLFGMPCRSRTEEIAVRGVAQACEFSSLSTARAAGGPLLSGGKEVK